MAAIKNPPNPTGAERVCKNCIHFHRDMRTKFVYTPNGPAPLPPGALLDNPQLRTMPTFDGAPCTFNPIWHPAPDDHWCSQFSEGMVRRPVEATKSGTLQHGTPWTAGVKDHGGNGE